MRHHCLLYGHGPQLSAFPERLELPFSNDEILCGYEDVVSSGSDHFTAWVKVSPHEVLEQRMVDVQNASADFLEDAQEKYRDSLAKHNIGEKEFMFFDRIALERHDYTATRAER